MIRSWIAERQAEIGKHSTNTDKDWQPEIDAARETALRYQAFLDVLESLRSEEAEFYIANLTPQ